MAVVDGTLASHGRPVAMPNSFAPKFAVTTDRKQTAVRGHIVAQGPSGTSVPMFSETVKAGQNGDNYTFYMVGSSPETTDTTNTITALIIPINVTFTNSGDVYSGVTTTCGQTQSALNGVLNSPELKPQRWYAGHTYIGHDQYTDAQMREEFWNWTKPGGTGAGWNLTLAPTANVEWNVSLSDPEFNAGNCLQTGLIDFSTWQSYLQNTVIPGLKSYGVGPTVFPIFISHDIGLTQPKTGGGTSCCVLGWHGTYDNPAFSTNTQTYAWADYQDNSGLTGNIDDTSDLSHEIAEWSNDPLGNNPVPPWGHVGQDPDSCQNNLEVGDPLTPNVFVDAPPKRGSFEYHLQELAFWEWFFDVSGGVNGWDSTRGTFTTGATLCS
jgi:hypothetical protein